MFSIRRVQLAVLVVAGLYVSSAASWAVDPRLLPANTEIVFSVNIKQILDSELVKSQQKAVDQVKAALEKLPDDGETLKYLKIMGFDPFTHLTTVTIAHPGSMDPKDTFVVIDGFFDAKKFAKAANTAAENHPGSMKVSRFGTTPVYEIQAGGETAYVALVGGKSVLVTTQEDALKGAVARAAGTTVVAGKVRELLKTTNDKQSMSFVITGAAMTRLAEKAQQAKGGQGIPGVGDAMAKIEGLTGAITITKEINFQLGIGAKDEKSAKDLANTGTAGLAFLNLMVASKAKQDPDFAAAAEVVRTLKISSVGANALLTGSVSQENLEKILKTVGSKLNRGF